MIIYFSDTAEFCCEQAAIAQSVVRNIGSVEVTGSIPVSSSGMIDSFQKKEHENLFREILKTT